MSDRSQVNISNKLPSGVIGFDDITFEGFPRGRMTRLMGGPGREKTVLAPQAFVIGAARHGGFGTFIASKENADCLRASTERFGWNIAGRQKRRPYLLDAQLNPDVRPPRMKDPR